MATTKPEGGATAKQVAKAAAQMAADKAAKAEGKSEAVPVMEPCFMVVKARPGVERFCRGGHEFGQVPRMLRLDDLTAEQVDAITREEMLFVEYGVDAEAKKEPEAPM